MKGWLPPAIGIALIFIGMLTSLPAAMGAGCVLLFQGIYRRWFKE